MPHYSPYWWFWAFSFSMRCRMVESNIWKVTAHGSTSIHRFPRARDSCGNIGNGYFLSLTLCSNKIDKNLDGLRTHFYQFYNTFSSNMPWYGTTTTLEQPEYNPKRLSPRNRLLCILGLIIGVAALSTGALGLLILMGMCAELRSNRHQYLRFGKFTWLWYSARQFIGFLRLFFFSFGRWPG